MYKKNYGLSIAYGVIKPSFDTIHYQEGGWNIARSPHKGVFSEKIFRILAYFTIVRSSIVINWCVKIIKKVIADFLLETAKFLIIGGGYGNSKSLTIKTFVDLKH